jgi:hypothetical protein
MPWQKAVVVVVVAVAVETMTTNDRIPCTTRRPSVPVSLLRYFRAFSRSTDSTLDYPEPIPSLINILLSNESLVLPGDAISTLFTNVSRPTDNCVFL